MGDEAGAAARLGGSASELTSALETVSLGVMAFDPSKLLPGVPADYVLGRLGSAVGKELESGKFLSDQSSSALAVNVFAWFQPQPELLPLFPGLGDLGPATTVDVEFEARFPWSGGRHPWLDAAVVTAHHLVGIESKRFEPFRDTKQASFADTYLERRAMWPDTMAPWFAAVKMLTEKPRHFRFLDAAQLIKHGLGIERAAVRQALSPVLAYLFAEPVELAGKTIDTSDIRSHRAEVAEFAEMIGAGPVRFAAFSYRDWLYSWPDAPALSAHRAAIMDIFKP